MTEVDRLDAADSGGCLGFALVMFILTITIFVVALVGCESPHHKTAAEIAHERKQEAAKHAAENRLHAAQARAENAAKPPTPPGIEQMDSTHFYIHRGFEGNTRDLCRTSSDSAGAGISDIRPYGKDMIITCNNPEHEYRHESSATGSTPAPAVPAPAPSSK